MKAEEKEAEGLHAEPRRTKRTIGIPLQQAAKRLRHRQPCYCYPLSPPPPPYK